MTLLIQAANVDYAYGGNDVLTGATFEIRQGDRLALIGANGSGKSTLFRLMAGQLRPQRGALTLARGVQVGFLTQEPDFDPARRCARRSTSPPVIPPLWRPGRVSSSR